MSFWEAQPVAVGDAVSQILSAEDLLTKINSEIDTAKIKLEYRSFLDTQIDPEFRSKILEFINIRRCIIFILSQRYIIDPISSEGQS
jgi:hypothetical protein